MQRADGNGSVESLREDRSDAAHAQSSFASHSRSQLGGLYNSQEQYGYVIFFYILLIMLRQIFASIVLTYKGLPYRSIWGC